MTYNKFFFKWIFPIIIAAFAYSVIGSFVDSSLDKEDLNKVTGRIAKIEYYKSKSRGGFNTNMRLKLTNGKSYKVTYEWDNKFNEIEKECQKSNKIQLFHRNSNQTHWRLGTSDIIYHLEIGNKVIIDIGERKSKSKLVGVFMGIVTLIGLTFLIVRRRRLRKTLAKS